jgi:hypothetical protein
MLEPCNPRPLTPHSAPIKNGSTLDSFIDGDSREGRFMAAVEVGDRIAASPGRAPPVRVVDHVRRTEEGVGRGKVRVEFYGASQQVPGFSVRVFASPKPQFSPTQETVAGFLVVGVLGGDA